MGMPMRRFFLYGRAIPILRAEEAISAAEVVSIPHMEKRARERTIRRLRGMIRALEPKAEKKRAAPDGPQTIGGIPADAAAMRAQLRGIPGVGDIFTIVRKKKEEPEGSDA